MVPLRCVLKNPEKKINEKFKFVQAIRKVFYKKTIELCL
uniref:Uncharacterized protein n=1 Tax=Rhizophora mucronata TaxID=61149 RepID=A0A2P2QB15_RHIMU